MYPYALDFGAIGNSEMVPESISPDDRSGVNVMYPDPVFAGATGKITGVVTRSGAPVFFAHVVAENVATGVVQAGTFSLSQNHPSADGTYTIEGLPAGAYRVYAEPVDGPTPTSYGDWDNGSSISWFYNDNDTQTTSDAPTTGWRTTVLPAPVVVTAGQTTTANIAVEPSAPAANMAGSGRGTVNCPQPGGGFSFGSANPVSLPSNSSLALLFRGTVTDVTTTYSVSDPTITLNQGCIHRSGAGSNATALMPVTVPPTARPGPRTMWITLLSGEVASCTGCLEIEGPETESGLCGNGIDDDGDGLTDAADIECFSDQCPGDPLKTAPGQCGCGNPDTDGDGDGTANCIDGCPSDPAKTSAGQCGCGNADTDTDGDGTANCNDGCPNDASKTSAGTCGCGIAETDTDGDGAKDCVETCDADPSKTAPGTCGCGVPETDTDGDGTKDCVEDCDADPAKTTPGTCGCGVAETDTDADGTKDCIDNCPSTANADQADANGNGVGDACEALSLRVERTFAAFGATGVPIRVFVDADEALCLGSASLRITFPPDDVELTGVELAAGCSGGLVPVAEGIADLQATCSPGFDGEGVLATLRATVSATGPARKLNLTASQPAAQDCDAPPNALAPSDTDGAVTLGCVLGDIHPVGAPNGTISIGDFFVARRMVLGSEPETAYAQACGDVHPGVVTCDRPSGQSDQWCATGDSDVRTGDVIVLRRRVATTYTFNCAACTTQVARDSAARMAGDFAPGGGDGQVGIADAVSALRISVGLDAAAGESLLRGDVAPARREASGLLAVEGDGRIGIADAVLLLRASVELERLAWPVREIAAVLDTPLPAVGWRVEATGWPAWAEPAGLAGDCDELSGLDAAGGTWSGLCGLHGERAGPHAATWRYRAPEAIDPSGLQVRGELVDDALTESAAPAMLAAP